MNGSNWDNGDIYDTLVAPLMSKVFEICKHHQIPMVASFQDSSDVENVNGYCTFALVIASASKRIRDLAATALPGEADASFSTEGTSVDAPKPAVEAK